MRAARRLRVPRLASARASRTTRRPGRRGSRAPVRMPLELERRVRVGVDGDLALELDDALEHPQRRIEPLGPAVDLDGLVEARARREHEIRVELALGAPTADDDPTRAVAE